MPEIADFDNFTSLRNLALATLLGFLIGFEREWTHAEEMREHSFAGARTFSLISFVGGVIGLMGGYAIVAIGLVVIGALTIVAYWVEARETQGRGGTTEIAIFAAYLLGVAATRGHLVMASAGAVSVAIILSLKDEVRSWARSLSETEYHAAIRFLAVSVLVLPVLPDRNYGPYDVINLRELWLMVIFISGLSFMGYWLVRVLGSQNGALLTGIVGGLASSTATTLSLSQYAKAKALGPASVASAIVAANVVMLARVALALAAVARPVLAYVAPALIAAGLAGAVAAYLIWRIAGRSEKVDALQLGNPFELRPALYFAGLLAVISLASAYSADRFGAAGLYVVGLISGFADVDAMTLSAGRQAAAGALPLGAASGAILIAVAANVFAKGVMATAIGGLRVGRYVIVAFAAVIAAGAMAIAIV